MSNFDFVTFKGGYEDEFVVHAKKYTKEQALELFAQEYECKHPLGEVVEERHVKYYVRTPKWCGYDDDGGCYTYCNEGVRGSFVAWVIPIKCRLATAADRADTPVLAPA